MFSPITMTSPRPAFWKQDRAWALLLVAVAAVLHATTDLAEPAQQWLFDRAITSRMAPAPAAEVALVMIDEASQARHGRAPWPRELHARLIDRLVQASVVVDHAEATSEKMAMGHWCDGRTSLVIGTHTHVPTADAQILPGGTAYQTDAGGCCDYDSVIGNEKEEPLRRFTTRLSGGRYSPASGPATICGVYVETDDKTGLATRIEPIRVGGRLSQAIPIAA